MAREEWDTAHSQRVVYDYPIFSYSIGNANGLSSFCAGEMFTLFIL